MNTNEIMKTLTQRAEYIRMREELDDLIYGCNNVVKNAMDAEGKTEIVAGPYKVVWREVSRTTLDSKALKESAPEIWKLYSREQVTRPFTVK